MLFKQIIGQEELKQKLVYNISKGRISHAQLFVGPVGSGNLALALAYAQYLFCKNPTENDSCGECPSCIKFETLQHPDLHFSFPIFSNKDKPTSASHRVDWTKSVSNDPYLSESDWYTSLGGENKQGLIGKDESNHILKSLSLKSYEGGYKVLIIWLPERMNASSANKLLKIIEEPPQKTVFLLVCHNYEMLLPTIISRVQLVKINRLKTEEIAAGLMSTGLNQTQANGLAKIVDGNWHEAKQQANDLGPDHDFLVLFQEWLRFCFKKEISELVVWCEDTSKLGRERLKQFLQYGLHLIRQSVLKHYTNDSLNQTSGKESEFLQKFYLFIHEQNVMLFASGFENAITHIMRNANAKIVLLDLSLNMCVYIHKGAPKR
jgi:DNA polymerase-3 subunit delta'